MGPGLITVFNPAHIGLLYATTAGRTISALLAVLAVAGVVLHQMGRRSGAAR